jgi:hypothetical protein
MFPRVRLNAVEKRNMSACARNRPPDPLILCNSGDALSSEKFKHWDTDVEEGPSCAMHCLIICMLVCSSVIQQCFMKTDDGYIQSERRGMTAHEAEEGIRQETVVIYSKVLTRHLCEAASVEYEYFPSKDAGFMWLMCYVDK